ncbi:MAG: ankyrin repeat domain-containing protein [Deltaproteobacteria bacterium]|nr:ankyrin repeat domain-containing protein [Deltaproteobacteria bacterium]
MKTRLFLLCQLTMFLKPEMSLYAKVTPYEASSPVIIREEGNDTIIQITGNNHQQNWQKDFMEAIQKEKYEEAEQLLQSSNADINAQNNIGWTAMDWSIWKGRASAVRFLLEHYAEVHPDFLEYAVKNSHNEVIEVLIERNYDINEQDSKGKTLLHWSVEDGKRDLVQYLLERGADPTQKDHQNKSPIDIAVRKFRQEILHMLRQPTGNRPYQP